MLAKFFANTEESGTSFQVAVFVGIFDKFFSFVIWHKLVYNISLTYDILLTDCAYFPN